MKTATSSWLPGMFPRVSGALDVGSCTFLTPGKTLPPSLPLLHPPLPLPTARGWRQARSNHCIRKAGQEACALTSIHPTVYTEAVGTHACRLSSKQRSKRTGTGPGLYRLVFEGCTPWARKGLGIQPHKQQTQSHHTHMQKHTCNAHIQHTHATHTCNTHLQHIHAAGARETSHTASLAEVKTAAYLFVSGGRTQQASSGGTERKSAGGPVMRCQAVQRTGCTVWAPSVQRNHFPILAGHQEGGGVVGLPRQRFHLIRDGPLQSCRFGIPQVRLVPRPSFLQSLF